MSDIVFIPDKPFDPNFESKRERRKKYRDWKIHNLKLFLTEANRKKNYYKHYHKKVVERFDAFKVKYRQEKLEYARELAKRDRLIAKLQKDRAAQAIANHKQADYLSVLRINNAKYAESNQKLRRQMNFFEANKRFFTKKFTWINWMPLEPKNVEKLVRYVVAYEELRLAGIVNVREIVILVAGYQMEYFSRKDIEFRFGEDLVVGFDLTVQQMQKANYLKKLPRKPFYYVTEIGKERTRAILKAIHTKPYKSYFPEIL